MLLIANASSTSNPWHMHDEYDALSKLIIHVSKA